MGICAFDKQAKPHLAHLTRLLVYFAVTICDFASAVKAATQKLTSKYENTCKAKLIIICIYLYRHRYYQETIEFVCLFVFKCK